MYSFMTSFYSKKANRWLPSPKIENVTTNGWIGFVCDMLEEATLSYPEKTVAPLISPAFYNTTLYRKNENVSGWSFICLDFDGGVSYLDIINTYFLEPKENISFFAYHTASSTPELEKFRIIIPVDRVIQPLEIPDVWHGVYTLFNQQTDKQCSDMSRGYYVPWGYDISKLETLVFGDKNIYSLKGNNRITFNIEGSPLNVDGLLLINPLPKLRPISPPTSQITQLRSKLTQITKQKLVKSDWQKEYWMAGNKINGGYHREFYKYLLKIVLRANYFGIELTENELIEFARELDIKDHGGPYYDEHEYRRQAKNALSKGAK